LFSPQTNDPRKTAGSTREEESVFTRLARAVGVRAFPLLLASLVSAQNVAAPAPVHLTAEQDHQRLMDLLHINTLRPGADGRNPQAPNYASYDESKANPYPKLPDALTLRSGKKVTSAQMWWKQRRPEIVEDFDREIYGRAPKVTPKVNWELISTTKEMNGDVPVITKELVGHVDNSSYPAIKVDIQLTLSTPANATGPVPVVMEFGLSAEVRAIFARRFPQPPNAGPSWQQQVAAKGWGYANLVATSIQADNGAGLTEGIIGLVNKGQPRKLDDWGALRAWAWGASRALDYFETDKTVDAKQVGIEGHSRYGKATLITMAYDPRFAVAYVSSSGAGGAALWRRHWGEEIGNVAGSGEYHWMAGNFLKYAGPLTPNDLPIDSHELIALCAPRPVFVSGGSLQAGDGWVDAKGMFMASAAAGPVYKLLVKRDMGTAEFPAIETPLIDGDIAFRQHSGGHTPAPNWPTFITFASRYIKGAAVTPASNVATKKFTAPEMIEVAKSSSAGLKDAIVSGFSTKDLVEGTAWLGRGPDFFFATEAASKPQLFIDDASGPEMQQAAGSNYWYAPARIEQLGKLHSFYYMVNGKKFGGRLDLPAFTRDSYLQSGVPSGTLSEKIIHTSKIYDGMKSEYWIYVPAQYDPKIPAALMVFQDGSGYTDREGNRPTLNVIDNLIAQKKIPVMIAVFINPGDISESPNTPTYKFVKAYSDKWNRTLKDSMRSTLYDTVSDRYGRYLRDEILADVLAKYNIRKDAYSRAITGLSSGAICAFNAAWQMPDQFSRVLSWIGSYASIQYREDPNVLDGGQDYPEKMLHEPKHNIRVWLQDGSNDLDNQYGNWSLANLRMANALKYKGYDFHLSYAGGTHNASHGAAEFPEEMIWLWRDYDPAKTEQNYEMDPTEWAKPPYRTTGLNRD
jgi:enterochelin esterase-like enzyme